MMSDPITEKDDSPEEFTQYKLKPKAEEISDKPQLSPLMAFGKKYGVYLMTTSFAICAVGVLTNLYLGGNPTALIVSIVGLILYLPSRVLYAVSKNR